MLKFLKDKKKDNKGFTLVELVIVVAILAILVGILAPQYTKYVEKSRKSADASNLENLVTVVKTAASDSTDKIAVGTYTITITQSGTSVTGGDLTDVLNEFAGNDWATTKLKSKNWKDNENKTQISATIVIGTDGSVTVTYNPTTLKSTAAGETETTK
mgnify:CR=1 FL=1